MRNKKDNKVLFWMVYWIIAAVTFITFEIALKLLPAGSMLSGILLYLVIVIMPLIGYLTYARPHFE